MLSPRKALSLSQSTAWRSFRKLGKVIEFGIPLYLTSNMFEGHIPKELVDNYNSLTEIDLSDNRFNGEIPWELGNCSSISMFLFHQNQLTKCIPSSFVSLQLLYAIYLNLNSLSSCWH
jgi:hypothetical protein